MARESTWDASLHEVLASIRIEASPSTTLIVEKYCYDGGSVRIKTRKEIDTPKGIKHKPVTGIEIPYAKQVADAIAQLAS